LCGPDLTDVFQSQPDRDSSMRMSFTTFHARRNSIISCGPFNDNGRRGSLMSLASWNMNEIHEIEDTQPVQIEELKLNANNKSSNTIKNEKSIQNEDDDFIPIKLKDVQVQRESNIPASSVTVTPVKQPQSEENPKDFNNSNSFASSRESYNSSGTNSTAYDDEDTEEKIEYISEIGPYDIICGRNNGANNSVGNRRFRVTIMMNLKAYKEAPTRDVRTNVTKSVIELMLDTNGAGARFIKKVGDGMYVRLTRKQIREKVGHSFREMIQLAEKEQLEAA